MSWSSWWSSTSSNSAVDKLEPDLREFLERGTRPERKKRDASANEKSGQIDDSHKASSAWLSEPATATTQSTTRSTSQEEPKSSHTSPSSIPVVPSESLYPDGRYAHLWKTYVPPTSDVSTPAAAPQPKSTDLDMVADLVSSIKDAGNAVNKSAQENCIEEQLAMWDCSSNGGWHARLTMCRTEQKELNRCRDMQVKFLKALGYQSLYTKISRGERVLLPGAETVTDITRQDGKVESIEVEASWDAKRDLEPLERMQLHADKLYREMIAKEKELRAARDRGEEQHVEKTPVAERGRVTAFWPEGHSHASAKDYIDEMPENLRAGYEKRLKDLSPELRALEERVIEAELREKRSQQSDVNKAFKEERRARLERQSAGAQTIGDRLKRLTGWSQDPVKD